MTQMNIDDLFRLLRNGHAQLQGIVDTATDPMLILDESLTVLNANRAFFNKFQVDRFEALGRQIYSLGDGQFDVAELRSLLVTVIPNASAIIDYRLEADFPDIGRRTILVTARTIFDMGNLSRTLLLTMVDATDRFKREASNHMLFGEMQHRMKNLLASTQALARLTRVEGRSAEEFRHEFMGRFTSLIRASEIAVGTETGGLRSLVQANLAPYANPGTIILNAEEDIDPGPSVLIALGLVLHELAANAATHGALLAPDGRVHIDWAYDLPRGGIRMVWTERGGPRVSPPTRRGYGTKLITSTITFSLGGELDQKFDPEGLTVEFFVPLSGAEGPAEPAPKGKEPDDADQGFGG